MREVLRTNTNNSECLAKQGELTVCMEAFSNLLAEKGSPVKDCELSKRYRMTSLKGYYEFSELLITEHVNLESKRTRYALQKRCQSGVSGVLVEDGRVVVGLGMVESKDVIEKFMDQMLQGFSSDKFKKLA